MQRSEEPMLKVVSFLLLAVALIGCGGAMPKPNVTGPVQTLGGGFVVDSGKLKYGMTYKATTQVSPLFATVEFENPESKSTPMLVKLGELSLAKVIIAQSPLFDGIRNNANYSVVLYVYSDSAMTMLIQKHSDQVRFSMQLTLVKQLGIRLL
jgi:hypothetical protein